MWGLGVVIFVAGSGAVVRGVFVGNWDGGGMEWWLAGGGDGVMVLVLENWWLSELLIRSHADWVGSTGWRCHIQSCIQHQFIGNRFACEFFCLCDLRKLQDYNERRLIILKQLQRQL